MDYVKFNAIPLVQIILLCSVLFLIFFILFLEPKFSRRKLVNKNEHGSSKFADINEIKKTFVK